MNQQTIDKIQPYIDEYCRAKRVYDISVKDMSGGYNMPAAFANNLIGYKTIMDVCEKEIMQILFEENQLPTNPLI